MKVEHILQSKGADVFSVQDTDTINKAVSLLNEKNIGAVVVQDASQKVAGILSERDVVRHLGSRGPEALAMRVSECMTPNPYTCDMETTVDELMSRMTEKRIRHMPVVNGDALVGVVSIGDVVKRKINQAEEEAKALKDYIAG